MEEIETVDKVVSTYKSDFSLPKGLWRQVKLPKGLPVKLGLAQFSIQLTQCTNPGIETKFPNQIWVSPDHIKSGQVWLDPILVIVLNIDQIET